VNVTLVTEPGLKFFDAGFWLPFVDAVRGRAVTSVTCKASNKAKS
jgi:hypothetical protein